MKLLTEMTDIPFSRRDFLTRASAAALFALIPAAGCKKKSPTAFSKDGAYTGVTTGKQGSAVTVPRSAGRLLLKNGIVVDGSGKPAFKGNVVLNGPAIELVTDKEVAFNGTTVDCEGKVIAPGVIDMHSHMDIAMAAPDYANIITPFTEQGVTTFIGGNCGYGSSAFRKDTKFGDLLYKKFYGLTNQNISISWRTIDQYNNHLKKIGITHNLANCLGYGTIRTSMRGYDPSTLTADERKEILLLIEEGLEQGACGVSFGLQYEPGLFVTYDEIVDVAKLLKKKDKIMTVHSRAYSSLSPTYPLNPLKPAHNIMAMKEMLDVARETGVRLQLSHLIFVGKDTWKNCGLALNMIEKARKQGVDVMFDTYAYHCGASVINVFLPSWFLGKAPGVFEEKGALRRLYAEFKIIQMLLGFGVEDIQITNANHAELNDYNGMFASDIAKKRGMGWFENFIDIAKKTEGRARVLNHKYSNPKLVKDMIRDPNSLFMTDAWIAPEGVQNPAAYGNFPKFIERGRDEGLLTLEETIRKMSGASAERFQIGNRGFIRKGYAADVLVFDYKKIRDNNTDIKTGERPDGIEYVFINGKRVLSKGLGEVARAGMVI